jgi:benzoyl-CoA reductase/2-hydroxyglutaryl-CoA dehydratase subunit BcrC/BadD/HgdB
MSKCCKKPEGPVGQSDPATPLQPVAPKATPAEAPLEWFGNMIDHCYDYAVAAKDEGRPVVGIMCEFAPRELILAAGGVPVCLCGGDADTIPAAEEHLPANLCPLIKSTYGYHVQGSNPFLEMADLVVAETTCDGKKKMFELLAESKPVHVMELTQKSDDDDAFEHWVREVAKLREELERRFGAAITDQKLREACRVMNRERGLRRELAALMKRAAPPIAGRQLLDFKSTISGIAADFERYEQAIALYGQMPDGPKSDRVRVMLTGVPTVHGAERVINLIEDNGGLIVCMESCTGLKPILDDVDAEAPDLIRAIARKYFQLHCAVMTPNTRRMEIIRRLAAEYRVECVVDLVWQTCTTYDVESFHVRRLTEKELDLPYLKIETDYSPSDSARIAVRVEALFETVRGSSGPR